MYKLATDVLEARCKQSEMNKPPPAPLRPSASDSSRTAGTTDYEKFERLAKSIDHDAELGEFEEKQRAASGFCRLDHVHGPDCRQQAPSCSHDHTHERNIYEKPYQEKLEAIRMFREEGNRYFKTKRFAEAASEYKRAMIYLDYTFGEDSDQEDELDKERLKCHLNQAAALLELSELSGAVNECRLALQIDSNNSKAHYRRGLAYLRQGELENAQSDLYKAIKLSADEPLSSKASIEAAIRELNVKWRDYRKKTKEIAQAAIK